MHCLIGLLASPLYASQEELLTLAKEVATSTQGLVQHVKNVAQKCDDKTLKASLVSSTKQTATTTSQLVACTKVIPLTESIKGRVHFAGNWRCMYYCTILSRACTTL